jgi:IS1 family transposase
VATLGTAGGSVLGAYQEDGEAEGRGEIRRLDQQTRHILAFHLGDCSRDSAKHLWAKIPAAYRERATFSRDPYAAYIGVMPVAQHRALTKSVRKTTHIERFTNTLCQRVSRLVRST